MTRRVGHLSKILREARSGGPLLLHCAWCGRLEIGDDWLHLDAIGSGQTRIADELIERFTHGICPECFDGVRAEADTGRLRAGHR